MRYDRPKFVEQRIDFCAPYEIARNDDEMSPYVVMRCTRGRSERAGPRVLATRARISLVLRYDRQKFVEQRIDFCAPYEIGRN